MLVSPLSGWATPCGGSGGFVDLHAEGKLNWAQAEMVRLEVEQLYQTYTDILVGMSDDEFAKHLNSRRRPL